jgi:hypothetical protein
MQTFDPFVIDRRQSLPYTAVVFRQVCAAPAEEQHSHAGIIRPMEDLQINFMDMFLHLDRHPAEMLQYFGVRTCQEET